MAKLTSLLNQRFLKREKPKMSELAQQSAEGNLTSFAGIFGLGKVSEKEREVLSHLLEKFSPEEEVDLSSDLNALLLLTSEVKAINNQAAILHGERIKKAQEILKRYKEGAFTAWLLATYGNRQTPYNFLQYYDFYTKMPKTLHSQIESMPRQAIYTLASRNGPTEKKEEIVRNYKGETKQELIALIRNQFPLEDSDKRKEKIAESAATTLQRLILSFEESSFKLTPSQKSSLTKQAQTLLGLIEKCKTF